MEEQKSQVEKIKRILLIGITGAGKSTLGNQLLEENGQQFGVGHGLLSHTTRCQSIKGILRGTGEKVEIIDSRGFEDNSQDDIGMVQNLVDLLRLASEGVHLVFFCSEHKSKIQGSEIEAIKDIKAIFGDSFPVHFLVTKMDDVLQDQRENRKKTYRDDIPKLFRAHKIEGVFSGPILFSSKEETEEVTRTIMNSAEEPFQIEELQRINGVFEALSNSTISGAISRITHRKQLQLEEKKRELQRATTSQQKASLQWQIERIQESHTVYRVLCKGNTEGFVELATPKEILNFCCKANKKIVFYQELQRVFTSKDFKDATTLASFVYEKMIEETKIPKPPKLRRNFESKLKRISEEHLASLVLEATQSLLQQYTSQENLGIPLLNSDPGRNVEWWEGLLFILGGSGGSISGATVGNIALGFLGRRILIGEALASAGIAVSAGIGVVVGAVVSGLFMAILYTKKGVIESTVALLIDKLSENKQIADFLRVVLMLYFQGKQEQFNQR